MITDRDLDEIQTKRLLDALARRSRAFALGLLLRDGSPESRIRIVMGCDKDKQLELMGLVTLLHRDVTNAAAEKLTTWEDA